MDGIMEFSIGQEIYSIPADRYYGRENHMWAQYDPAKDQVTLGMDALGLVALGDLAYVTLLPEGTQIQRGKSIGTLEAAKMTGNLPSPISGKIVARNESVIRNPSMINQNPYREGWLVILQPADWQGESAQLISCDMLPAWVEGELERYRQQGWID